MSSIIFRSPTDHVYLCGSERAYMGIIVNDVAFSALAIHTTNDLEAFLKFVPASSYMHNSFRTKRLPEVLSDLRVYCQLRACLVDR